MDEEIEAPRTEAACPQPHTSSGVVGCADNKEGLGEIFVEVHAFLRPGLRSRTTSASLR